MILWAILWPWSVGFRLVIEIRNALYNVGLLNIRQTSLPVLSVGNLTVGGTGKTPTCLWLAQNLQRQRHAVAILTRGYGGTSRKDLSVRIDPDVARGWLELPRGTPLDYGDEPVMMSALYGHIVGVGVDRYRTALEVSQEFNNLEIFILDDGFQHRRVKRDLDLLLLGSEVGGSMLPAGPLREPLRELRRADILMVTAAHDRWRAYLKDRFDNRKIFYGSLKPRAVLTRMEGGLTELTLGSLAGTRVLAVSAIANSDSFYRMIRESDATIVDTLEFPDHHRYSVKDWREINRYRNGIEKIVTTEKDFVKLLQFPFPGGKLLALQVEMSIDQPQALLEQVVGILGGVREI